MKGTETMASEKPYAPVSKIRFWTGTALSVLPALFLILDAVMKIVKPQPVLDATAKLGYSESTLVPLAIVLLASAIIYLIPRTAVIGAILLTGYLGGAVASHVRIGDPALEPRSPSSSPSCSGPDWHCAMNLCVRSCSAATQRFETNELNRRLP